MQDRLIQWHLFVAKKGRYQSIIRLDLVPVYKGSDGLQLAATARIKSHLKLMGLDVKVETRQFSVRQAASPGDI